MKIIIKKITSCKREEINVIYNFLWNLDLQKHYHRMKKIKNCILIWFYINNETIIWFSAIKQPNNSRIEKLNKKIKIVFNTDIKEYWYVYVTPKYRWLWISKKIYKKLSKKIKYPIYSITKTDNFAMKNLFKQFWFINKWILSSTIDWKSLDFYIKT